MVCLLLAGIALSELGLAGLRVRRVLPPAVHAGTPYLMGIALENRKRRLPSFSIEVEDLDRRAARSRSAATSSSCPPAGCRRPRTATRSRGAGATGCRGSGWRPSFPSGSCRARAAVADVDELCVYPALHPGARGAAARPAARTRRPDDRPRPAGRASSTGCASSAPATTRATSTGARARAAGYRWCARKRTRRRARRRSSSTTPLTPRPTPAAFERAVSEAAGICVELAHRGFSVGLAVRGGEVRAAVGRGTGGTHPARAGGHRARRRAAARIRARHRRARPPRRAARRSRRRGAHRLHDAGAGMRFAAAHKLVTYLLVLAALAAVASTRVVAPASALLFLAACALSFCVEGGNRVAAGAGSRCAAGARGRRRAVRRHRAGASGAGFPIPTSRPRSIWCWPCSPTSCSSGAPIATTSTSRR